MIAWTPDAIRALPEFGANGVGWFYGLVTERIEGDDGPEDCLVLAEIFPGMGYALIAGSELGDADSHDQAAILADLTRRFPAEAKAP
jgi:inorganic pyrophosphatase